MMEEEVEMVEVAVVIEWEEVVVIGMIEVVVMIGMKEVVIEDLVLEEKMIGRNQVAHHNVKREEEEEEHSVEVIEEVEEVEIRLIQMEHGGKEVVVVDFLVVVEKGLKVVGFQEVIGEEAVDLWAVVDRLQLQDQNICV
jgi:hypothetical protein